MVGVARRARVVVNGKGQGALGVGGSRGGSGRTTGAMMRDRLRSHTIQ